MIEKVEINNFATYSEPTTISNLKKINFIYGNNGSGKTTISNFLHDQSNPDYCDCSIIWKGGNQLDRAVYNKQFRENNFDSDDISGVFTLGHATADDIKRIEELRKQRDEIKEEGIKKKETAEKQSEKKDELESEFRDNVWKNIYKKYENDFKEAFKGSLVKEKFKNKLLAEYKNNDSTLIDFSEILKKAETVFGDRPDALNNIRSYLKNA